MHLKQLHINDFRNIRVADIALGPRFNYFYGPNGAGKTSVLEAIATLSRGRSFRTHRTQSLIQNAADSLIVRGTVEGEVEHQLAIQKSRAGITTTRLDGQRHSKMSDLARLLPTQVLLPDAAELVFGSPGLRRAFLDWGLFHVEPLYLNTSRQYQNVLQQRNAWLKVQNDRVREQDDPWRTQLLRYGVELSEMRARYVKRLTPVIDEMLNALAPGIQMSAKYAWGGLESAAEADKKVSESFSRDVKLGTTHRGPQRADLILTSDAQGAAELFSRGQAKAVASALLLAQAAFQRETTGRNSIFLIDDFGAELDLEHWQRFTRLLLRLDCQVIVTSTEPPMAREEWLDGAECGVFHVEHGVITREESA